VSSSAMQLLIAHVATWLVGELSAVAAAALTLYLLAHCYLFLPLARRIRHLLSVHQQRVVD
jgi:hypothetical protein